MSQMPHMSQSPDHGLGDSSANQLDADVQREMDEALKGQDIEQLMESAGGGGAAGGEGDTGPQGPSQDASAASAGQQEFHHEVRRGRVAAIRGDDVFVELSGSDAKMQGVAPLAQFDRSPRLGSIMDFVVDHVDEHQGLIYLSREGAISQATWRQMQRGAVVEARVIATNKGGLELEMIGGIRAFMPASQIDLHHVGELEPLVGQKLEAMVQEIDRKSKKVVLNRRQLLEHRREQAKQKLLDELGEGQLREGTVTKLVHFGAFVDLGGMDGLVHISDLSYSHVNKPSEVVKRGDTVQVKVLKVDRENERIGLGLKQIKPDPWDTVGRQIHMGDQVTGRVLRTANFGAFVEVEPGIEGLLPLSEMSWRRIHKPEEVLSVGQHVHLSVLSIEPDKQRLSLSLKQAQGDPWVGAEHKYAPGGKVRGTVTGTPEFGAFVELEPGVEGLVHISQLADQRVGGVEDVVKVGDEKEFRVLEVDEDQRRIGLSLREQRRGEPASAAAAAAAGEGEGAGKGEGEGKKTPSRRAAKPGSRGRKSRRDLKGGMEVGGVGLGHLRLNDMK